MLPPEWPLDVVSSFIQRALRRQLHDQHTWQILKAISAGENMAISEEYLDAIRRVPPVVQPRPPVVQPRSPSPPPSTVSPNAASSVDTRADSTTGSGYSEKDGLEAGVYSRPDEGSIAEKEGGGGAHAGDPLGAIDVGEKERGFFSPEIVDKELRSLSAGANREEAGSREGYL